MVTVTRDVTEQESSREQLAAGAEYLRRTLNATGDAIFATDALDQNEPVRFVNQRMLQMWGIPAEKADALTPTDIMHFGRALLIDAEAEGRRIDAIVAANVPHESYLHLRDGRVLLRHCIPARVAERDLRVWGFRDISAEAARLAMETELRSMLDVFAGYIAQSSEDFRYEYTKERFAAVFGLTPADLTGCSVRDVVSQPRFEALCRRREELLASGRPVTYEHAIQPPGGAARIDLLVTHFAVEPSQRRWAAQVLPDLGRHQRPQARRAAIAAHAGQHRPGADRRSARR